MLNKLNNIHYSYEHIKENNRCVLADIYCYKSKSIVSQYTKEICEKLKFSLQRNIKTHLHRLSDFKQIRHFFLKKSLKISRIAGDFISLMSIQSSFSKVI